MCCLQNKKDIKSMTLVQLEEEFSNINLKKYKAFQVFKWLNEGVDSFDNMSNISLELREYLNKYYYIVKIFIKKKVVSVDNTVKYLLQLSDGQCVEAVLMEYKYGNAICISTQVGCRMNCRFCANSGLGFIRNLAVSEMIAQIDTVRKDIGKNISNVTLMGIGEPFDNYENVVKFLKIVSFEKGLNIGARHVSISTCGISDKIRKLADEKLKNSLSVSLHAAKDSIRNDLMPINRKFDIKSIINSCKYYIIKNKRRITFEYIMIKNVNDSFIDAKILGKLISGMLCHVNLIPVNNINKNEFEASSKEVIRSFANVLINMNINVTIRRTLGADIEAACGQLKRSYA